MWEKVKLGDICKIINGHAFKSSKYVEQDGARVIRITNVQKGRIVDNDPKLYPFDLLDKLENFEILENDILMSLTGNVGRVGLFPKRMLPAYLNQRVCKIHPISRKISKRYLYQYLNSDIFEKEAIKASGGAAQLNLSSNWVSKYEIPLPPLPIQEKIAEILDKADELRRKDKELQTKYDELAQAIFIDMFGDPVKNEKGWEVKRLDSFCSKILSGNTPKGGSEVYVSSGIKFFRSQNVWKNKLELDDIAYIDEATHKKMRNTSLRDKDILITKTGRINTENSSLGRAALYRGENDTANLNGHVYLIRVDSKFIIPEFVVFILTTIQYRDHIRSVCVGGIDKRQLNKEHIQDFPIILPPLHLQEAFAKKIELINQLKAQTNTAKSEELFQSLLQKAFKGELVTK